MESIFVFNDTATTWIYTYRHTSFPTRRSSDLLDAGSVLTEITAICEYLEERFPDPTLIGSTAEERAKTRMWTRRVDLKICEPLTNGFRFAEGLPLFEARLRCLPDAAEGLKSTAQDGIKWLDAQIAGRQVIAGHAFSLPHHLYFTFPRSATPQ